MGITLPQFTGDRERFMEGVAAAEASCLDSVWVFDHLWPLTGGKERPVLEAWTSLSVAAAATSRIGVGTLVTRSTLRNPTVLAHMATTVARIARDRLIVGIGSGDSLSRDEDEGFGFEHLTGDERRDQLRSVAESLMREERRRFGVWVGGRSRALAEMAGAVADGFNVWGVPPPEFARRAADVRRAAAGRPVEISWGGLVQLGSSARSVSLAENAVVLGGDSEAIARSLAAYVEAGASHLVITPAGVWDVGAIETLCGEILPAFR